jgi:hypothetical protein
VRRPLQISGVLALLGVAVLTVILIVLPGDRSRALDVYILYLGALALLALARATAAAGGGEAVDFGGGEAVAPPPARLPELARVEREVVLSTGSEFDQQLRVRPLLRDVAAHRLWTRRGVDIEENPERARELLGPDVWELVKAGPPDADRRYWRGLDLAGLGRIVDQIEAL